MSEKNTVKDSTEKAAPAFTSGPWFWKADLNAKQISLQSEGNMRQYVMDFTRWGAGGAPRFTEGGLMHRGDVFAAIVEGREHHASWFQSLDHPDARLIAAAPSLYAKLQKICRDNEADCGCECNTETCCARVGEPCAKCDARAALALADGKPCPDCGCNADRHNAVNEAGCAGSGGAITAHCKDCGTCYKSEGTPFVAEVEKYLSQKDNQ